MGDQIKKTEMGRACSAYEGEERLEVLVGKPEGRRPLRRHRRGWEDNIKINIR
jgi:hypothetical protein